MSAILGFYFGIGFSIGFYRLSKLKDYEQSPIACVVGVIITVLWPIYLIYKLLKESKP